MLDWQWPALMLCECPNSSVMAHLDEMPVTSDVVPEHVTVVLLES